MTIAQPNVNLSKLKIAEIKSRDCFTYFQCGIREIDKWAVSKAHKHHQQDRARVFCARQSGSDSAIGFYSLSLNQISANHLFGQDSDRYHDGHAPFIYIDWFAVSKTMQSCGIGKIMMIDALKRAYMVSLEIPFYGVALRSLNEKTTEFYQKLGFVKREETSNPIMILPIWTVRDLFKALT